ncbi:hypothetical protein PPUJ20066_10620 [Pseudomonas putida]|nr:hypothetical protein PPUJ20066_10620 [Pseudomonas putida]
MSATKDYFFEMDDARRVKWIKDRFGMDVDPEADPELWEQLSAEYTDMIEAAAEEAEYRWLERHSHNEFFYEFSAELTTASSLLTLGQDGQQAMTVYKLVYAHAVTLLEALIGSVVRTLVISEPDLMMNVAKGYEEANKKKYTIKEIASQPKGIETIVLKLLSGLSFHNTATIKTVLEAMFGQHMAGLELDEIARICDKRHDIIHRNGRTIDDVPIQLDAVEVGQALVTIRDFAADLKTRIYAALEEIEEQIF